MDLTPSTGENNKWSSVKINLGQNRTQKEELKH